MGSLVPSTHFSTRELPPGDKFDAWRDAISVIFDVDRIGNSAASFEADVDAYQIGNLVITVSSQGEQAYSATPKRIRRAGIDLIQVGLYRSGGYCGETNDRTIEGQPGDLQVLDLAQPMKTVEAASDMICVFLPRETLQNRIGDLDGLHGARLHSGLNALLADYLSLLAMRLPQMTERDVDAAANASIEMIAACLRPAAKSMPKAKSSIEDVILLRAKRFIEANLHLPQLTPDLLCRTIGVSRRSLYRVFEPLGGVHRYILQRRLELVMDALTDPGSYERIADLAGRFGFTCQETFWRAFKRRYGLTPGDVRASRPLIFSKGSEQATDRFDRWLKELRP